MSPHPVSMTNPRTMSSRISRRQLLCRSGMGIGMLGLACKLSHGNEVANSNVKSSFLSARTTHFEPRAQHVVHLFMNGGPSQVDTFDYKPFLAKHHGNPVPNGNFRTERLTGGLMKSPFRFRQHGESGLWVSDLFARTAAQHVDDMCIVRSMFAEVPNHEPSLMLMNCGDGRLPRPSFGAWVTYGLGTENENLPAFLAMCPRGYPIVSTRNWRSAFLPGACQGTYIDTQHSDIKRLIENIRNSELTMEEQRSQLELAQSLNQIHAQNRHDDRLEARIKSFELAYRMQTEAAEAFDLNREPEYILEAYGRGIHGRQLLITRRLIERGVRFVQVWSGAGQPWDNHDNLAKLHRDLADEWDKPIAAFLADLKQRGLFESTLVLWGGEFGRTPVAERPALNGRDHNHYGFTCWLAGGGARGGYAHGETDEFGFRAVQDRVSVHDLHATMLHLLGMDHKKLTYRYAGRDFRLTDVHGNVIRKLIG